jgi:hypothetical protein
MSAFRSKTKVRQNCVRKTFIIVRHNKLISVAIKRPLNGKLHNQYKLVWSFGCPPLIYVRQGVIPLEPRAITVIGVTWAGSCRLSKHQQHLCTTEIEQQTTKAPRWPNYIKYISQCKISGILRSARILVFSKDWSILKHHSNKVY